MGRRPGTGQHRLPGLARGAGHRHRGRRQS